MRIAIDIDNTITSIKGQLTNAAIEYAMQLGKYKKIDSQDITDTYNDGNIYQKLFNFTYDELKYFLGTIQEGITNNATPRNNCADVICRLRSDGNEIFIITARDSEFHNDPYHQSKEWLKKNNIQYDKLIVNARDKSKVCLENDIDLLIDDNISNCISVSNLGIDYINVGQSNKNKTFDNWNDIYKYINQEKIVKIIRYQDKYKEAICKFINESMHEFIGRPYKERFDVSNIENYYFKNNGNFWLALDVKNKEIVGSIAFENLNNYGVLKRFYVDKSYHKLNIGKRLYNMLENFVKNETNINKIYLACGHVLQDAHKFYLNNGFEKINNIDIEIHYAEDDDFFVKEIY